MVYWSISCFGLYVSLWVFFVFPVCIVMSKGPVSSTASSSSSSSSTSGAAGAGASQSTPCQASPSLALPLAQGEQGPPPLRPLSSHSFPPCLHFTLFFHLCLIARWSLIDNACFTACGTETLTSEYQQWSYKPVFLLCSASTVKTEPGAGTAVTAAPSPPVAVSAPTSVQVASAATIVKQEQGAENPAHDLIKWEPALNMSESQYRYLTELKCPSIYWTANIDTSY